MSNKRLVLLIAATALLALAVSCALAAPPKVVCVQAFDPAQHKAVPHSTWSGREITLCGVAHDPDGDATIASYVWDFGDGSPGVSGPVTNPYIIEAKHTYTGQMWEMFVAKLTVTDTSGQSSSDDYLVMIEDGGDLRVKVNVAIDLGLWRLHKDMTRQTLADGTPAGYWAYSQGACAATGACTEAFEIQGSIPAGNPDEDPYVDDVRRGLNYLLSMTKKFSISQHATYCPLGTPDHNGNGIGLGCYTGSGTAMYECGITLMTFASSLAPHAIAATGIPEVKGREYGDIVQDMVEYLAYGQNDSYAGSYRGGWRYSPNTTSSDNSCSQWPVIGMEAAETNFGSTVPGFVKPELNGWIDFIQNDSSGGSGYEVPTNWVNIAKTGGLLAEMKFMGESISPSPSPRMQAALNYISAYWTADSEHFASFYSLYSAMKGFRLLGVQTINPLNDPAGFDWYGHPTQGYAQFTVGRQDVLGAWPQDSWARHPLNSAWALLTLQRSVVDPPPAAVAGPDIPKHPPCPIMVALDGSSSFHRNPGRRIVRYVWDFGDGSPVAEGTAVTHCFPTYKNPDGTIDWAQTTKDYTVTLTVYDDNPQGAKSDSDTCVVTIGAPPWNPVGIIKAWDCAYPGSQITLDGSTSYDPNGQFYPVKTHPWYGWITKYEWDFDNDGAFDDAVGAKVLWSSSTEGLRVVKLRVTNNFQASDQVSKLIDVNKGCNQPPDCSKAYPSFSRIWPPNSYSLIPVKVLGVKDPNGDPVKIKVVSIFQDEPVKGQCTGDISPDGFGIGTDTARLRAERGSKSNGRVYTVTFTCEDTKGGKCSGTVKVGVPRSIIPYLVCVDDGPKYDSTLR